MGTLEEMLWHIGLVTRPHHKSLIKYQASRIEDYSRKAIHDKREILDLELAIQGYRANLMQANDQLAAKTLELESLKNKIVERAQVTPILKAKSSADVRRIVEQDNEREFEESSNGIR